MPRAALASAGVSCDAAPMRRLPSGLATGWRRGAVVLALLLGVAGCRKREPVRPFFVVQHPNGKPAAHLSLWCGWGRGGARSALGGRRWVRTESDERGRVYVEGDPAACLLEGDDTSLSPQVAELLTSDAAPITAIPKLECATALIVATEEKNFVVTWFRRHTERGEFLEVSTPDDAGLAAAARKLWQVGANHSHPEDRRFDCALIVPGSRDHVISAALAQVTRQVVEVVPLSDEGFTRRETSLGALRPHAVSADFLCAWLGAPPPPALRRALGEPKSCGGG